MPQYEYKCSNCQTIYTEIRKIDERNLPLVCTTCKKLCEPLAVPSKISILQHSTFPTNSMSQNIAPPKISKNSLVPNATLTNVHVENCMEGIRVEGPMNLKMKDVTFKNVEKAYIRHKK